MSSDLQDIFRLAARHFYKQYKKNGGSQAEIAEKLGVTQSYVSAVINGSRTSSMELQNQIANILYGPFEEFLTVGRRIQNDLDPEKKEAPEPKEGVEKLIAELTYYVMDHQRIAKELSDTKNFYEDIVQNLQSGVLVTEDIDTGKRSVISVAVNEGLGGAVDGQAAESLRINLDGSPVRVLATATDPWRRVPNPKGGLLFLPSSGSDTVLQPEEIEQLIDFARHLPDKFPPIVDEQGNTAPADVEFGFRNGDLRLFQLRPFLDSQAARGIEYLREMDAQLKDTDSIRVDMNGVPEK